jgi:hypothetical protein
MTFSGGGEAEGDLCAAQEANRTAHRLHHAPERCVVIPRASVADPDTASRAFLTPGFGILIQDGKKSGSGMNISDHISKRFWKPFPVLKMHKFFAADLGWIRNLCDPRSGIRDGKIRIRDKHPRSATLPKQKRFVDTRIQNVLTEPARDLCQHFRIRNRLQIFSYI